MEWKHPGCAFKFLLIGETLVIGAVFDHSEVFALHKTKDETHDIRARAKQVAKEAQYQQYVGSVSAAGQIGHDGQITGWKSNCFCVDTPHSMKEEIEGEVTRLFHAGALTP